MLCGERGPKGGDISLPYARGNRGPSLPETTRGKEKKKGSESISSCSMSRRVGEVLKFSLEDAGRSARLTNQKHPQPARTKKTRGKGSYIDYFRRKKKKGTGKHAAGSRYRKKS